MKKQLEQTESTRRTCPTITETRWNSIYCLLHFIETNMAAINETLCSSDNISLVLSFEEKKKIIECSEILRPLAKATESFSAEEYVTSSLILPFLHALSTKILAADEDDSLEATDLKNSLSSSIIKKYEGPVRHLLLQCSFLDPRFKDLKFASKEERLLTKKAISEKMKPEETLAMERPAAKKRKLNFLESMLSDQKMSQTTQKIASELEKYSEDSLAPIFADPIEWWKGQKNIYPSLSEVAKQVLSATATSAPSERRFKKASDLITKKRASLSPKSVEMMVFLFENKA